jgi:hypothetical protein
MAGLLSQQRAREAQLGPEPTPEAITKAAEIMRRAGRNEDKELAHVAPKEIVIPLGLQDEVPDLVPALRKLFADAGFNMDDYTVADTDGNLHALTGLEEFFSEGDGPNGQGADGESAGHGGSDPGGNDAEASMGHAEGPSGRSGAEASAGEQSDNSNAADNPSDGESGGHGGGAQDFSFETTLSPAMQAKARSYGMTRSQAHNRANATGKSTAAAVDDIAQARHAHNPTPAQRAMNRATQKGFAEQNPGVVGLSKALATLAGFAHPGFGAITAAANLGNMATGQPAISYGLGDVVGAIQDETGTSTGVASAIQDTVEDALGRPDVSVAGEDTDVDQASSGDGRGFAQALATARPRINPRTGAQEFFSKNITLDSGVSMGFDNEADYNAYANMLAENNTGHQDTADVQQAANDAGQSFDEYRGDMAHEWNSPGNSGYQNARANMHNDPTTDPDNPQPFGSSSGLSGPSSSSGGSFPPRSGSGGFFTSGTNQSVAGHLDSLLRSDSPLMQRAASQGLMAANRRGLLNSTQAVEAAQAAMLDRAIPIASQDSAQDFQRSLSAQNFGQDRVLQGDRIASTEFMQGRDIASTEYMQARDIGLQDLLQQRDIASREGMQARDIGLQDLLQQRDIASREGMQARDIGLQDLLQQRDIASREGMQADELAAAERIADMEAANEIAIANLQVGADDREKIAALITTAQTNYQSAYQTIINNEQIPAETRDAYLTHISSLLSDQITMVEGMYNVDLDWATAA